MGLYEGDTPHHPHTNTAEGKTVFTAEPRWNWFVQSHLIPECDICPHRKTTGYNVSDIIPSDIAPPNDIIIHPKWGCHHWAVISKCSWNRFYRTRDLQAKHKRSHEAGGVSSDITSTQQWLHSWLGTFSFHINLLTFMKSKTFPFFSFFIWRMKLDIL